MDAAYVQTVRLLLETAPVLFSSPEFVMKGGTAINLFVEDMPRLSVDIDVVWKDHMTSRERVIAGISETLQTTRQGLEQKGIKARIRAANTGEETKLFVERENRQVKIEVNHVFRGTVLLPGGTATGKEGSRPLYDRSVCSGSGYARALREQDRRGT
jgi:predicted nucleotidyltransferase component of viral defense system